MIGRRGYNGRSEVKVEQDILAIAIKHLSEKFDEFIAECVGTDGKPIAPSQKAIMRARGYLPPYCKMSLTK